MQFEPVELEVEAPKVIVDTAQGAEAWVLEDLKAIAARHPGRYRLALLIGRHTLALGPEWNVEPSLALTAALGEFGDVSVVRG